MLTRRTFLALAAGAAAFGRGVRRALAGETARAASGTPPAHPVAVSSENGLRAVQRAVERMRAGADPLDAAVEGVGIIEDDPSDMTVGYGGVPNEEGVVQLDASVMHGPTGRAGAVAAVEGVKNPARLAKLVMETTDHILVVGPGARRFAEQNGIPIENLLTPRARKVWLYWKQNLANDDNWIEPPRDKLDPEVREFIDKYGADIFHEPRHGTVHMSAIDTRGDLAGCTSTSGLFFKIPGRAGDSPIIGAGCYTDNEVGSAGSTGRGEADILVCGGHTVVEMMRQGKSPEEACLEALKRVAASTREARLLDAKGRPKFGIRFYAVNKRGAYGSASMWGGSSEKPARFAVADSRGARLETCAFLFPGKPAR